MLAYLLTRLTTCRGDETSRRGHLTESPGGAQTLAPSCSGHRSGAPSPQRHSKPRPRSAMQVMDSEPAAMEHMQRNTDAAFALPLRGSRVDGRTAMRAPLSGRNDRASGFFASTSAVSSAEAKSSGRSVCQPMNWAMTAYEINNMWPQKVRHSSPAVSQRKTSPHSCGFDSVDFRIFRTCCRISITPYRKLKKHQVYITKGEFKNKPNADEM